MLRVPVFLACERVGGLIGVETRLELLIGEVLDLVDRGRIAGLGVRSSAACGDECKSNDEDNQRTAHESDPVTSRVAA